LYLIKKSIEQALEMRNDYENNLLLAQIHLRLGEKEEALKVQIGLLLEERYIIKIYRLRKNLSAVFLKIGYNLELIYSGTGDRYIL